MTKLYKEILFLLTSFDRAVISSGSFEDTQKAYGNRLETLHKGGNISVEAFKITQAILEIKPFSITNGKGKKIDIDNAVMDIHGILSRQDEDAMKIASPQQDMEDYREALKDSRKKAATIKGLDLDIPDILTALQAFGPTPASFQGMKSASDIFDIDAVS